MVGQVGLPEDVPLHVEQRVAAQDLLSPVTVEIDREGVMARVDRVMPPMIQIRIVEVDVPVAVLDVEPGIAVAHFHRAERVVDRRPFGIVRALAVSVRRRDILLSQQLTGEVVDANLAVDDDDHFVLAVAV